MHTSLRMVQTRLHYRMWRTSALFERFAKAMTRERFLNIAAFYSAVLIAVVLPFGNVWQVLTTVAVFWTGAMCLKDAREVWRSVKG